MTKLQDLQTHGELVGRELVDPDFRHDWERLALARAVAARLIRYRSENGLSQKALAETLGLRQPNVARLEAAEHEPTHETLAAIAEALGIEFTISITPRSRKAPKQLTRTAREEIVAAYDTGRGIVRLSAT